MINARTEARVNRNKIITSILIIMVVVTMFFIILLNIAQLADYKQLTRSLEKQNTELERFNYTVSHDLRTPIVTIKGFLGLLEDDIAEGKKKEVKFGLERISIAADQIE